MTTIHYNWRVCYEPIQVAIPRKIAKHIHTLAEQLRQRKKKYGQ